MIYQLCFRGALSCHLCATNLSLQVFKQEKLNSAFQHQPPHPPFARRPEVYKQPRHLPPSENRLTLYYCQSVTPVNVGVSMMDVV